MGIRRPILVDELAGQVHRAYGGLPNMSWVLGRGGQVLYKAAWTRATAVEAFVARYTAERAGRSGPRTPYFTEQIELREVDRGAFYARLRRNGPRAYDEFLRAEEIWRARQGG